MSAKFRCSKYEIDIQEHVNRLSLTGLKNLCQSMSRDWPAGTSFWPLLAEYLGMAQSIVRIEASGSSNPAHDVMEEWKTKSTSTVGVLKNTLVHLKRHDLVTQLEELCRGMSHTVYH
jgi:Death domain